MIVEQYNRKELTASTRVSHCLYCDGEFTHFLEYSALREGDKRQYALLCGTCGARTPSESGVGKCVNAHNQAVARLAREVRQASKDSYEQGLRNGRDENSEVRGLLKELGRVIQEAQESED